MKAKKPLLSGVVSHSNICKVLARVDVRMEERSGSSYSASTNLLMWRSFKFVSMLLSKTMMSSEVVSILVRPMYSCGFPV